MNNQLRLGFNHSCFKLSIDWYAKQIAASVNLKPIWVNAWVYVMKFAQMSAKKIRSAKTRESQRQIGIPGTNWLQFGAPLSLTLICKFLGHFWGRFTGKLIHQKMLSTYSVFKKTGSSPRPFYWKIHPIVNWTILGRHTDRFTGKLIHLNFWLEPSMICNIWSGWVFQENGLGDDPFFLKTE